jgi:prolyl oligopeptidase
MMAKLTYPQTRTGDHVDSYHGTPVPDPYRWLEDLNASETSVWIEAQNSLTFDYLGQLPGQREIRQRLTELWDYPKTGAPFRRGARYFQFRNSGLQNQDVLHTMQTPTDEGRIVIDPNALSEDGTTALSDLSVSWDAEWLAYAASDSGSDWRSWHIRNVASGEDLDETLKWSKFSGASWLPDNSGFYYGRYDAPAEDAEYAGANYNQRIYLHHLGTPQTEDILIYDRPDQTRWGFDPTVTDDGRYLILHVSAGTDRRNRIFYRELESDTFIELIGELEAGFEFVGNSGTVFYFRTDLDAPRGKVISIDVTHPQREAWRTLIPEGRDVLEHVSLVHDEFVIIALHDAYHQLHRYDLDGAYLGDVILPAMGSISALSGRRQDDECFFAFSTFTTPPAVCRYDFREATCTVIAKPDLPCGTESYVTEQLFVTSKDGTQVPLFVVHHRAWSKDGQNPTLLYGYGGFNIATTPSFQVARLVWLEMGGVLAVANLRGGGEYGEEWHAAGTVHNKQNVFDDFVACAEHLIESGITCTPRLAIEGRSNGGLLVGACLTQRPDLFGAALPTVGVMDMLRFHQFTIGWAWVSDYGSAENSDEFRTLHAYSPLHNTRPACYPPTLILTGDHDDRVMPAHSYKFAAALQAAQQGEAPILIRIQTNTGHGAGKPTHLLIEERADMWAFVAAALEMTVPTQWSLYAESPMNSRT